MVTQFEPTSANSSRKDETVTLHLSAITYNIHAFVNQFWTGNHKEKRIAQLLKNDGTGKPYDIVCLDEAWQKSASQLIQRDTGYRNAVHSVKTSPQGRSVYGDGLATLTNWHIVAEQRVCWKHHNWGSWEGKIGAWKGFSYVKLQHPVHPRIQLVVYNLHGLSAHGGEHQVKVEENFRQLGEHVAAHAAHDAVLVGGDFNWRHRWRAPGRRPEQGPIDPDYGQDHPEWPRCDAFGVLMEVGGLLDAEYAVKGTYDWSTAVDRWFVKSGREVDIRVTKWNYLGQGTPYHGLSDHHPQELHFELTYTPSAA
jgi:hypothetical protein